MREERRWWGGNPGQPQLAVRSLLHDTGLSAAQTTSPRLKREATDNITAHRLGRIKKETRKGSEAQNEGSRQGHGAGRPRSEPRGARQACWMGNASCGTRETGHRAPRSGPRQRQLRCREGSDSKRQPLLCPARPEKGNWPPRPTLGGKGRRLLLSTERGAQPPNQLPAPWRLEGASGRNRGNPG